MRKAVAHLVFRDGRRIGRTRQRAFTDTRARPGRHRYAVVALDAAGRRGRPSHALRVRVKKQQVSPFLPAAPAGPDPSPDPPPPVGPLTAAMVERLFWRAGFGATQAQRDAWIGRGHLELVDWLLDTPRSLAPTSTPPLTGGTTNLPIDPLASEDELVMEWLDRMQRAVNPLPERLAFFWHRQELKAGQVEFNANNLGMDDHDFSVRDAGGQVLANEVVLSGDSVTVRLALAPAVYTLYCSLLDHEALGMRADVTVR